MPIFIDYFDKGLYHEAMNKIIKRAYKYRFYPQDELKIILAKTFGCVRFVYNKTLDFSEKHYAQKEILESQGLKYKNLTGTDRVNFVTELKNTLEDDHNNPNYGMIITELICL